MRYAILKVEFYLDANNEYQIRDLNIKTYAKSNSFDTKTINTAINTLQDLDVDTVFVNDLDKFYIYLIDYLAKQNVQFTYAYKAGKCSNVKTNVMTFVNFKSKFGIEYDDNIAFELIDYAIEKGRTRCSLGADAWNEFVKTLLPPTRYREFVAYKIIREQDRYPIFDYNVDLIEAKYNVAGYQMCKTGTFANVIDYDISSSYPASALCQMPKGLPKEYTTIEDCPATYFKIIKFSYFNCKIKPNKIAFVRTSAMGQLVLPEKMFELFKQNYNCKIVVKKVYAFKTEKSPFVQFMYDNIINGKINEPRPHIAKYNKNIGNAIIGYLGRNTTTTKNTAIFAQKRLVLSEEIKTIEPIYLPAYLCVLDRSKSKFIRTVQKYQDKIIYANTDGFLAIVPINLQELNYSNALQIGNYRQKHNYVKIHIESINGFCAITDTGELDNTLSGITMLDKIEPEQYKNKQFEYYINTPTDHGTIKRQTVRPHQ